MHSSLESRAPFLNNQIVDFADNLNRNLLIKGKEIILCSGLFGSKDDSSFCDTLKKEFKYEIIENKGKSVWGEQWYDYDDNSNWEIIRFYN